MRRVSTSLKPLSSPQLRVEDLEVTSGAKEEKKEYVKCIGKTAQLHQKAPGFELKERRASLYVPPIISPSRRQSISARSTNDDRPDVNLPSALENSPREEPNRSYTGPKFILNVISESSDFLGISRRPGKRKSRKNGKLPIIQNEEPKSVVKQRKRSNFKKTGSKGGEGETTCKSVEIAGQSEEDKTSQILPQPGDEDATKYGLDLKRDFGWDISRAFTFSYFPQIKEEGKKKEERKKKASQKYPGSRIKDDLVLTDVGASER